jgi:hypothetical protein
MENYYLKNRAPLPYMTWNNVSIVKGGKKDIDDSPENDRKILYKNVPVTCDEAAAMFCWIAHNESMNYAPEKGKDGAQRMVKFAVFLMSHGIEAAYDKYIRPFKPEGTKHPELKIWTPPRKPLLP